MSLLDRLMEDQKEATRAKDRFRLTTIRMLRAELQNAAIAKRSPLDPEEELSILTREVKRRQDSRVDYAKAGRPELLEELDREIALLRGYLPEQLSQEELADLVRRAVKETGASTRGDLGKVMGWLMPKIKGKADGKTARDEVEKYLK